jgi:hypothetical protein
MNRNKFIVLILTLISLQLFCSGKTLAQSDEVPKVELGVQFTSITKPGFNNGDTEPGLGGRFTFNLNRSIALEAVGNFFPHNCRFCGRGPVAGDNSGNITQGLFGVKAGKRFEKWGIFGKARPGMVSFSSGDSRYVDTGAGGSFPFELRRQRLTNFAADLGVVIEFYPSRRLVTRFEAGDTLIHYGPRQSNFFSFDPSTGTTFLVPFTTRSETRHNFQFAAGVGWRF